MCENGLVILKCLRYACRFRCNGIFKKRFRFLEMMLRISNSLLFTLIGILIKKIFIDSLECKR